MVAIPPGQNLSLRFGKEVDKRSSRFERGSSVSGVGPSIGVEVRLVAFQVWTGKILQSVTKGSSNESDTSQ